jgi:RNA polymerase sigma-70 factor (ECF subfamily)
MMGDEKNIEVEVSNSKLIEQLCSGTWEVLYRFVYFKVQNREEAEDITQETYFKALSYMKKNTVKADKLINFLKTVSLNVLRDKWRSNKRTGGLVINIEHINPEETAVEDPTEDFVQREIVQNALKLLKEEQSLVIDLRIIKGYSVAETAKQMNKTESNVRVLQYRALQKLSAILKNDY